MIKFEKTFIEWWKSLTPNEKDDTSIVLSKECNTAISTVQSWGRGYRVPKVRSQDKIVEFMKEKGIEVTNEILFP